MAGVKSLARNLDIEDKAAALHVERCEQGLFGAGDEPQPVTGVTGTGEDVEIMAARDVNVYQSAAERPEGPRPPSSSSQPPLTQPSPWWKQFSAIALILAALGSGAVMPMALDKTQSAQQPARAMWTEFYGKKFVPTDEERSAAERSASLQPIEDVP